MRKRVFVFLTFVLVLPIVQYLVADLSETNENTIKIQLDEEITNIDTRNASSIVTSDTKIAYQYQGYLGQIAPGEITVTMPGIADGWSKNEDGTEWVFTLREGLTFHDGSPINAKTVRYSLYANWMIGSKLSTISEAMVDYPIDITFPETDPQGDGLVLIFKGDWFPDPMFEFDICGNWQMYVLVPYGSHGLYDDNMTECQRKTKEFLTHPISAGPYKFVEWKKGEYVLLERFDDWFGWGETFIGSDGKEYTFPTIEKSFKYIQFKSPSETNTNKMKLLSGDVDVITSGFVGLESLVEVNNTEGFSSYTIPTTTGDVLLMNIQGDWPSIYAGNGNFPVSQDWFRRAVSHAINRTNIVEKAYLGIADERYNVFPDWALKRFTNIDVSDYYNFHQGMNEAEALLNAAGYTPLGFTDEPDNRFGWGLYANETDIGGIVQTKGRHFTLVIKDSDPYIGIALDIQKNLKQIGIYVDIESIEEEQYKTVYGEGTPGFAYNISYIDEPDPKFKGPHWDFMLSGSRAYYDTTWDFIALQSFAYWMFFGWGGMSWHNINYEVAYAKATGGSGLLQYIPDAPAEVTFPIPEWSNNNPQFIEGCEDAGYEISHSVNRALITWYLDAYAFNDHIHNFKASRNGKFLVAYSYSDLNTITSNTEANNSSNTPTMNITSGFPVFVILFAVISLVYRYKKI